jgi:hypothetical protein
MLIASANCQRPTIGSYTSTVLSESPVTEIYWAVIQILYANKLHTYTDRHLWFRNSPEGTLAGRMNLPNWHTRNLKSAYLQHGTCQKPVKLAQNSHDYRHWLVVSQYKASCQRMAPSVAYPCSEERMELTCVPAVVWESRGTATANCFWAASTFLHF